MKYKRHPKAILTEPTEAELEQMIAEQMQPENLPSWWYKSQEREFPRPVPWTMPVVQLLDIGKKKSDG